MKRLNSSDSLGGLISICPSTEDRNQENSLVYGRDYFDEEGCVDECGQKKRRLSAAQVKALEKDFEVENKLEPDRKAKLAHDLGLQPRQVAVWFQNRRARWKTKQLERDYGVLKANFDALKCNHDSVQQENEALVKEIRELKSKLQEDNSGSSISVKEELIVSEAEDQLMEQASTQAHSISSPSESDPPKDDPNFNAYNNCVSIFKDGGTSSDSSAIMNNEESNSPNAAMSSSSLLHFKDVHATNSYQPQFVKIEEHNFFSGEEACNFFLDDQAPTLQWYCSDQWS